MLLVPSGPALIKTIATPLAGIGVLFAGALPFRLFACPDTCFALRGGWAGYALHDPGTMLSNWPGIFMMQFARLFVNPDFANWSGEGGHLHWIGKWDGFSSLYNHLTSVWPGFACC